MISKESYYKFLNRELDNFDWVKEISPSQIDSILDDFDPKLLDNLWKHQKMMLAIMQNHPRFMLFASMGGGKTKTILTFLRNRKLKNDNPKAIIFVPYLTAVSTWMDETLKWAPELVCTPLLGTTKENLKTLASTNSDLYPICYQSAVALFTNKVLDPNTLKKKWIVDKNLVKEVTKDFDTLVMDEIHRAGSSTSQTFSVCEIISKQARWVYGLTGTPYGSDPMPLWSEFYLVDKGETLSPSLNFYREVFFTKKFPIWGGVKYEFKKKLRNKLQNIIKNKSIYFSTEEMIDLPEKQYIPIRMNLPNTIKGYVEKAFNDLRNAILDQDYELVSNKFVMLRQLSSGFLTFKPEDEIDKERIKIKFDNNPKLDALMGLIEESDSKIVVFHDYIYTNEIISECLTKKKIGHARIWGGQRDPIGQLKKFRDDKNCKVLVINAKSGSSSLNLQFASTIIFYECPAVIDRTQAEARCWRPGQTQKVKIYDLLIKGTLDEDYYETVKEGGDLLKKFLTGKKKVN